MKLRMLVMDVGYDDQFAHIPPGVMELSRALYENQVPFRLDVDQGDHRERVAQRLEEVVFPAVASALAR